MNRFDDYQDAAAVTGRAWDDKPYQEHRLLLVAGLTGEAGEVADRLKKEIGHGHAARPDLMLLELGDALWYLSELARKHGYRLSEVANANLDKIHARYPNGFSERASQDRAIDLDRYYETEQGDPDSYLEGD